MADPFVVGHITLFHRSNNVLIVPANTPEERIRILQGELRRLMVNALIGRGHFDVGDMQQALEVLDPGNIYRDVYETMLFEAINIVLDPAVILTEEKGFMFYTVFPQGGTLCHG